MRTVDQVIADLKKAREATRTAQGIERKFEDELQEIHNKANAALKELLSKPPVYRSANLGPGSDGMKPY